MTDDQTVTLVTRNKGFAWLELLAMGMLSLYVVHPEPFERGFERASAPIRHYIREVASWWRTREAINALPETDG